MVEIIKEKLYEDHALYYCRVTDGDAPWKCSICGKKFNEIHLVQLIPGTYTYECENCYKM